MEVPLNSVSMCSTSADQLVCSGVCMGLSLVQHKPGFGPFDFDFLFTSQMRTGFGGILSSSYLTFL